MPEHRKLEIELDPSVVLAVIIYKYQDDGNENELDVEIETVVPDEELAGFMALTALDLRSRGLEPHTEVTGFQLKEDSGE